MHHKYHTEAIVLGSSDYRESAKIFFVFTRDLGLLYASAQGVRKMSSKLRYVLQDFSYTKIDLVKGKDFWRITSACKTNQLEEVTKQADTLQVFAHVSKLLRRLLPEQEKNEDLFREVINGLFALDRAQTKEDISNIEIIIVLRILSNLGYIGDINSLENLIKSPLEEDLIFEMSKNKSRAILEINKALRETQL
ncbi:MAG: DNA repair protein RecO [bacterium]|nr:DNA repair protein RecO [bacterium]